jgi:lipoprotein-releasing system ATP-binding protein
MTPLLKASDLKKTFSSPFPTTILQGASLEVFPEESVAITGRSGEGKSTLLHILGTLDLPTSGTLTVQGKEVNFWNRSSLRKQFFGFVFQSYHLLEETTALDNVLLPARLRGVSKKALRFYRDRALSLLEELHLSKRVDYAAHLLSGGEKQRVALARAFLLEPPLILADEPTGNLDSQSAEMIHQKLLSYAKKPGKAVIVVTHNKELASQCNKQYTLEQGIIRS